MCVLILFRLRSVALNGSPLKCSLAIKIILKTHGDWLVDMNIQSNLYELYTSTMYVMQTYSSSVGH